MFWAAIDVGLVNLAFLVVDITSQFEIQRIVHAKHINLCVLPHGRVKRADCVLYHSNDAYDRVEHFLQEYGDCFDGVEKVFIERQPIGGLVHVEQLLFGKFRDRVALIAPTSMHKHFKISHLDYEHRKVATVEVAKEWLQQCEDWRTHERLHDMADAFCLLKFQLDLAAANNVRQQQRNASSNVMDFLEQFRFKSQKSVP